MYAMVDDGGQWRYLGLAWSRRLDLRIGNEALPKNAIEFWLRLCLRLWLRSVRWLLYLTGVLWWP